MSLKNIIAAAAVAIALITTPVALSAKTVKPAKTTTAAKIVKKPVITKSVTKSTGKTPANKTLAKTAKKPVKAVTKTPVKIAVKKTVTK